MEVFCPQKYVYTNLINEYYKLINLAWVTSRDMVSKLTNGIWKLLTTSELGTQKIQAKVILGQILAI